MANIKKLIFVSILIGTSGGIVASESPGSTAPQSWSTGAKVGTGLAITAGVLFLSFCAADFIRFRREKQKIAAAEIATDSLYELFNKSDEEIDKTLNSESLAMLKKRDPSLVFLTEDPYLYIGICEPGDPEHDTVKRKCDICDKIKAAIERAEQKKSKK